MGKSTKDQNTNQKMYGVLNLRHQNDIKSMEAGYGHLSRQVFCVNSLPLGRTEKIRYLHFVFKKYL
jgi:hypothetical protein